MFSKDVTNSDEFLDMPLSSQALYFHLGINADDDGFVQPRGILRLVQAKDDDLKVLKAKGFIIEFEQSVIVITHWKVNNQIRKDRKKDTIYQEHLSNLGINNVDIYQLQPSDNQMTTKCPHSIVEDSIGKVSKVEIKKPLYKSIKYLKEIPLLDLKELEDKYKCSEFQIKSKADDLVSYCEMHGKKYKNYRSFLLGALKRDFGVRSEEDKLNKKRAEATRNKINQQGINKFKEMKSGFNIGK